jgi:hypothetical protein
MIDSDFPTYFILALCGCTIAFCLIVLISIVCVRYFYRPRKLRVVRSCKNCGVETKPGPCSARCNKC